MDKLISLQDAIKAINEKAKRIKNEDTLNGLAGAVGILFDLPSVKPQETKAGYWIYDNIANNWRCDKCGETPKTMGYCGTADFMAEHFKFCNHCGAKMVEPQERSE